MAYFKINDLDILPYIEDDNFRFEDNDLDSDDAGRTLDAEMHRGKIADKVTWSIKLRPLPASLTAPIYAELVKEFVTVTTDIHPRYETATLVMYNSKRSAKLLTLYNDGTKLWKDFTFNLIER